jgi:hypothetical protein
MLYNCRRVELKGRRKYIGGVGKGYESNEGERP